MLTGLNAKRILCLLCFAIGMAELGIAQDNQNTSQQLNQLLQTIETLGPEQFDPCLKENNKKIKSCKITELILWSGYYPGIPRDDYAATQAPIGLTPAGRLVKSRLDEIAEESDVEQLPWEKSKPIWEAISAKFVDHLLQRQKEVSVYIGKEGREKSIFCEIELPRLLENKSRIDVVIKTTSFADHNDMLITSTNQWPCGKAANQARANSGTDSNKKRGSDTLALFERSIETIALADPVSTFNELIASIRSNPILAHINLSKAVHLKSNHFDFQTKMDMAGEPINFSGSLMINPQPDVNELFLKIDANLTSGKLAVGSLQATAAKLTLVIVNASGTKEVHARIQPEMKSNGKSLDLTANIVKSLNSTQAMYDFDLGQPISLPEIIPTISDLAFFEKIKIQDIKLVDKHFKIAGEFNQTPITVDLGLEGSVSINADQLKAADIFPHLTSIPVLDVLAVEKIGVNTEFIEVEVLLNGQRVDLVQHLGKGEDGNYIVIFFDRLQASSFIPAAKGHLINDLELNQVLFIIKPGGQTQSITSNHLPGDLARLSGLGNQDTLTLKPGLNISSKLNAAHSEKLSGIFKSLGLEPQHLPLRGTLPVTSFQTAQAGSSSSRLEGLNLEMDLPAPRLPGLQGIVQVNGPAKLKIGGGHDQANIWSRLPPSLSESTPEDGLFMSVHFDVELTTLNINEKLEGVINLGVGQSESISLLVLSEGQWRNPFGIPELTLRSGGFQFEVDQKNNTRDKQLAFFGIAQLGKHNNVTVSADFSQHNGKLVLNYFDLEGKFNLKDIPGGQYIPQAEKYELDEIKLASRGVEAKTIVAGKKVDAFLFEMTNNNWVFALDQKDFKFAELIPAIKKIEPLDAITLSNAALLISKDGLSGNFSELPVIAQDLLRDIYGNSTVNVNIPGGIGLISSFNENELGVVGKGLKKIGVHDDAILMGEITGVFQGTPGIELAVIMEQASHAIGIPRKVISVPTGASPQFFIQWSGTEFYVGAGLGLNVNVGKDRLHLESKLELDFSAKGIGIDIVGEMDGPWHNPFGIKNVSLSDITMKVGINDIGEVLIGIEGHDIIDKEEIKLATEIKILLEDALPDGVAFSGSMTNLGVPALVEIAEALMGVKGKISAASMPFFEIHEPVIAFATPGASDPQLGLDGSGFAVNGEFFFMNKRLGKITGVGGLTKGITFTGDISDIDLDVLTFRNNNLDMAINLQPKFILNSDVKFLGAEQRIKADFKPPHFAFDLTENLGHFGDANLRIRFDGLDLKHGTYFKNSDISVIGEFKSTLVPWMKQEIKRGIDDLKQSANAKLDANLEALKNAQIKVDELNVKIQAVRAKDDKAKSRTDTDINTLERRVSSLKSEYQKSLNESKHCGKPWSHFACEGYWKVKAEADYKVYQAAEAVLEATKKAVAAAFDLDPRLAILLAERDIAHVELSIAQGVVDTAKEAEDFVRGELEKVLEDALKNLPFEIEEAFFVGDLRDMITDDAPLVLDLKFKLYGTPMREYFAIKVNNPAFDAVAFGLLPVLAMDKMTETVLQKADPQVARWVHAHIATKLVEVEAIVRDQVKAEEKKYAKVLESFEKGGLKYEQAFAEHTAQHAEEVKTTPISDLFGDSKLFENTFLAVGHSHLCLGVANNGTDVIQENCQNNDIERWTTVPQEEGYVQLKNKGLCLKARDSNSSTTSPLILSRCNNKDEHERWKVISSDGFYDKIINRHSQKCLHFNKESANPETAKAIWTSCFGADSQTFRDIKNAEKPTWHNINAMLQAKNGSCLSVKGDTNRSTAMSPLVKLHQEQENLSRQHYTGLKHSGHDILLAEDCNEDEDRFNYLEAVNGDIKLVHAATGWCVHPKPGRDQILALAPCDRGEDMFWRLNQMSEAWMLQNVAHKNCLALPDISKKISKTQKSQANLDRCQGSTSQLFDFIRAN